MLPNSAQPKETSNYGEDKKGLVMSLKPRHVMVPPSIQQGASKHELKDWIRNLIKIEHAKVTESEMRIKEAKAEINIDKYAVDTVSNTTFVCMRNVRGFEAKKTKALNTIERLEKLFNDMVSPNNDEIDFDGRLQDILQASAAPAIRIA
jgi:hypothetical protein